MNKFKRPDNWMVYYKNNILTHLLEKLRSVRDVLADNIKNTISGKTYISTIIRKLGKGKKSVSQTQIAFAISTCELILNPENSDIHVNETVIKLFLIKNLKKIRENEDFYFYEESDERDEENEKEKDERDKEEKKRDKRKEKKEEGNEGEEEEDYEGTFSYQSSSDEQSKESMRKLRKVYGKKK
ncbi:hypothetical protein RclHR1_00490042 [Rhizophagus clarus]|uniref:Uncharacterized protein n=1 Tax=Rhizophagus clarus TaxID=94130 RepID=A0A2Z6RJT0_9GLOM|nr:hypothetical protein RclHR1_00490042 [Rhizophagus clarus]